jgi:hypothetical protein
MKKIFFLIIVITVVLIGSCNKKDSDPDYCGGLWATTLANEALEVYNASMAYSLNPTTTTCTAYKSSVQSYLDELKKYDDCSLWTAEQKADLADSIHEAELELASACSN